MNAFLEIWFFGAYDSLRPRVGSTVIDAGANVGLFTMKASGWVGPSGHVVAVEPIPANCRLLERNLKRNGIKNVTVVQKAISDEDGVRLNIEGSTVESVTLDGLHEQVGNSYPESVKIDIEGYEVKALQGGQDTLRHARRMAFETHSKNLENQVKQLLVKTGFQVFDMSPKVLLSHFVQSIITNPSCFLENEVERARSWNSTGGPFLLAPINWFMHRTKPDWMNEESTLKLLTAQKNLTNH
jgi:hypothetical protein